MKLSINEMAKLMGLSKHTLRYYDKINLISPQFDNNGYRHYNADHILELGFIRLMRDMDVPISEIRESLKKPFISDEYNQLLEGNKKRIDDQIIKLQHTKALLERKIEFHNHYKLYLNKPIKKRFPERLAIKVGEVNEKDRTTINNKIIEQICDTEHNFFNRLIIYRQKELENLYLLLTKDEKVNDEYELLTIPEGEYTSLLLEGTEEELKIGIKNFLGQVTKDEDYDHQFFIECMNEDYILIGDEQRYVTEIQILHN